MGCQEIRLLQQGVQLSTVKIFYKNQYYRFFVFDFIVIQVLVQIMHYSIHKGSVMHLLHMFRALCIFYICSDVCSSIVIVRVFFLTSTHLARIQIFHHCRICVILYSINDFLFQTDINYSTNSLEDISQRLKNYELIPT
jgi:hypothetical protein